MKQMCVATSTALNRDILDSNNRSAFFFNIAQHYIQPLLNRNSGQQHPPIQEEAKAYTKLIHLYACTHTNTNDVCTVQAMIKCWLLPV